MMCLLLDPYLLWLPPENRSRDRLVSFADNITQWRPAATEEGFRCLLSDEVMLALSDEGCYPSFNDLKAAFARYEVREHDAGTVFRALDGFLRSEPYLERYIGFGSGDVVVASDGPKVRPAWLRERLPARVGTALGVSLVLTAVARRAGANDGPFALATRDRIGDDRRAEVEFVLEMVQALSGSHVASVACPVSIAESMPLVHTLEEAVDSMDLRVLWAGNVRAALHSACRRCVGVGDRDTVRLAVMRIHGDFQVLVERHRLSAGEFETILRKIGLLIGKQGVPHPSLQVKALEYDGVRRVRQGDSAEAMRAHLTEDGPGYRLHYWQLGDGVIELATVNTHEDYSIPE